MVQNFACLCKVNKDVIWSSSIVVELWVLILTPIDEDDVPPNGGLHGLIWTKCTSSIYAWKGNEAKVCNVVLFLPLFKL